MAPPMCLARFYALYTQIWFILKEIPRGGYCNYPHFIERAEWSLLVRGKDSNASNLAPEFPFSTFILTCLSVHRVWGKHRGRTKIFRKIFQIEANPRSLCPLMSNIVTKGHHLVFKGSCLPGGKLSLRVQFIPPKLTSGSFNQHLLQKCVSEEKNNDK